MANPYGYPGLGPYRRNARPQHNADEPRRTRYERADLCGEIPTTNFTALTARHLARVVFTVVKAARAVVVEEGQPSVRLAISFGHDYSPEEVRGQLDALAGQVELPLGIRVVITRAA